MSATSQFYATQADASARAAAEALLPNVKERCLRAELAWRQMADRADRMSENRRSSASAAQPADAGGDD